MRFDNWQRLFAEFLERKRHEPFEWGKNDCILFSCQAVEVITGKNHYSEYLGYDTEEGAYDIVREHESIEGLISKHFGAPHTNFKTARRGDLVLFRMPFKTMGVVDNSGEKIACLTEGGMVKIPLSKAIKVWRVD